MVLLTSFGGLFGASRLKEFWNFRSPASRRIVSQPVGDFTGTWNAGCFRLVLTQSGTRVTGIVHADPAMGIHPLHCSIRLQGVVYGNLLQAIFYALSADSSTLVRFTLDLHRSSIETPWLPPLLRGSIAGHSQGESGATSLTAVRE